jgi:perosamine synthetase
LADLNVFSFHPVKHITTGEGGIVALNNSAFAEKIRHFRNHGITQDHSQRALANTWYYTMEFLGFNYRMSDFQAALGISQLKKLEPWLIRRRQIASQYDRAFEDTPQVRPLEVRPNVFHSYHLYVVRLNLDRLKTDRDTVFKALRAEGIGVNVHYLPVYLHPFYRKNFGTSPGLCPIAETVFDEILTLPIFPLMKNNDIQDVIDAVLKVLGEFAR